MEEQTDNALAFNSRIDLTELQAAVHQIKTELRKESSDKMI